MCRNREEIDKNSGEEPLTDSEYFCYVMGYMEAYDKYGKVKQ